MNANHDVDTITLAADETPLRRTTLDNLAVGMVRDWIKYHDGRVERTGYGMVHPRATAKRMAMLQTISNASLKRIHEYRDWLANGMPID